MASDGLKLSQSCSLSSSQECQWQMHLSVGGLSENDEKLNWRHPQVKDGRKSRKVSSAQEESVEEGG